MTTLQSLPVGVVEDDSVIRSDLVEMVNQTGRFHCAVSCESGEEALAQFPRLQPQMALVDLELPGMDGRELCARLRERLPALGLIVVTQHDDDARLFGALEAGALGYLLKPVSAAELAAALELLLAGGTPMTPGIARRTLQTFHQRGDDRRELAKLSVAHQNLLSLVAAGMSRNEVAFEVGLSPGGVFYHQRQICKMLQVDCMAKAVAKYQRVHAPKYAVTEG